MHFTRLAFLSFLGFSIFAIAVAPAQAQSELSIVAARATGADSKAVFAFLNSTAPLSDLPTSQFIKLEILFLKPVLFDQVRIETCGQPFRDGIDFYMNFDDSFRFEEGGKSFVSFAYTKSTEVAALTVNFRRNSLLCLKSIEFKLKGQTLAVKAPLLIETKVTRGAPAAQNLFDSKLNSYMKFAGLEKRAVLPFLFSKALAVDQLLLWSGNFTTDLIFKKFSRLKNLDVQCDQGASQSFELKDQLSPQIVHLTGKLNCQKMNLIFNSVYPGSTFSELALTELRFLKGDQVYIPDISHFEQTDRQKIQTEFAASEFSELLVRQLLSSETKSPMMLRLHADGSFFLHGVDELAKENTSYYILGDFSATSLKHDRIQLKLRGIKRSSSIEMDSLSCGRKCFNENDFSDEKYFFEQEILIRRGKDRFYRIDTLTEKKLRRIDFTGIRFLLDHSQ